MKTTPSAAHKAAADISDFDRLPGTARIRITELKRVWGGCSNATVYRLIKRGVLPPPYRISARISAWNVEEVRQALAKCEQGLLGQRRSGPPS